MTQKRQLSSDFTLLIKYVFPGLFYFAFIFAIVGLTSEGQYGGAIAALAMLLIFGTIIYLAFVRLQKVHMDEEFIYISNYFKTIKVPINELWQATDLTLGGNYQPIILHFKNQTVFGKTVMFINSTSRWFEFSTQPITKDLQDMIDKRKLSNNG